MYYVLVVLSCGMLYLAARWFPKLRALLTAVPATLNDCDLILAENVYGDVTLEPVFEYHPHDIGAVKMLLLVLDSVTRGSKLFTLLLWFFAVLRPPLR